MLDRRKFSFFIIRVLFHYDFEADNLADANEILSHASVEKENFLCHLNSVTLGKIVNDIWGEKVKRVRRGPRTQRKAFYQNLKIREIIASPPETFSHFMEKVNGLKFKDGWSTVCGNNKLSFVRLESWSFRNQRGSTEVCIEQISSSSGLRYSISSHGCEYSLTNMIDLLGLEKRTLGERVHKILEIVDSSALCSGVDINETTSASMSPHVSGEYRHNDNVLFKVFSKHCHIIQCSDGISCANCRKIKRMDDKSKKRKLSRDAVHPFTNKRYMTRDELTERLTEEVKARKNTALRESYWREKYFSQCVEMEKEDHKDLCKIFADAKNVPEEMADLWKQQEKILQTGSKNGFRWHPK